ncbi:TonB-dependent receptor plug domain-containing protein [Kriegella aquimaris]|nr:TonB-dependent receptor [Kriegella aquimaris]
MAQKTFFLLFLMLFGSGLTIAQNDSIIQLEEVVLSDARLYRFAAGIKIKTLSDSLVERTNPTFTDMLRFNSSIYLKENGYGMVSSPSFRGTNAQHTAVVWNGININSPLTGQTDFGTLIPQNYDRIAIRSGGGSVQYGSGAIGGSIHLNNLLAFEKHYDNVLQMGYGSYNTQNLNFKSSYGSKSLALGFGMNYVTSDNDYEYLGREQKNENGEYHHLNFNIDAGYFFSKQLLLKLHHNTFFGDRNLSGTLTAPSDDKYKDINTRSLLEMVRFGNEKLMKFKLAHLFERYEYYANKNRPDYSLGSVNTIIAGYDHKQAWGDFTLNGLLDYKRIEGKGSSLEDAKRNQWSGTLLATHHATEQFRYGFSIRKDWVNDFESPLLLALNGSYKLSDFYLLKTSASKNFRLPTFNDLYWLGAGNLNLVPETSYQVELGQLFKVGNASLELTAFYIDLENMIQWRPNASGLWVPQNIQEARQYGLEAVLNYKKAWGAHHLELDGGWAYTRSVDKATEKQLLYVPLHKINGSLNYSFRRYELYTQALLNHSVYITTDESNELPGYTVVNLGGHHNVLKLEKLSLKMGLRINNIFNEEYQSVAYRPMPNRNFLIQIIAKF